MGPQIFNFILSVPQLFKIMPCPRHRLPRFMPDDNKMTTSTFAMKITEVKWWMMVTKEKEKEGHLEVVNMTLINVALHLFGPMHEKWLCAFLLGLQLICCAFGFFIRYRLA